MDHTPFKEGEGNATLYAYLEDIAIKATPLGVLKPFDALMMTIMAPVEKGNLLFCVDGGHPCIESYWLEADNTASLLFYSPDVYIHWSIGTGQVEWYGGSPVIISEEEGMLWMNTATRELEQLRGKLTFDVMPTEERLDYEFLEGDAAYVNAGGVYRCDAGLSCTTVLPDDPKYLLLKAADEMLSDGVVTYVQTGTGAHHFLHGDVVSEDLSLSLHIVRVRLIGGKMHFEGVNADNVGGLFSVDFVDGTFVYTEVETYEGELVEMIPLEIPG